MKKYILYLGRTEVFFFALFWLMVLLFIGTVAQKDIGLYAAQHKYFSSFFFMAGGTLPLPAGYTIMAIIFSSLTVKLFSQPWHIKKAGTLITHIGGLMLLFGGFLTAVSSYEGSMVIEEGKTADYIEDYYKLELVFIETTNPKIDTITAFSEEFLQPEKLLKHDSLPFSAKIIEFKRNARLSVNNGKLVLIQQDDAKEEEENVSGLVISIEGKQYVISEFMQMPPELNINGKSYIVQLRHKRTHLPFKVKLLDFETKNHPGSGVAKTYSSEVVLHSDGVEWHSIIKMNEPLRYKGYTLFQASFVDGNEKETTVLAVVKNLGRMFPYIASIIMCIGLLIHLFQRLPSLFKGRK